MPQRCSQRISGLPRQFRARSTRLDLVRTTLAISAAAHALIWALAALHGAHPLADSPEAPIAVEIISPEELAELGTTDKAQPSTPASSETQPAPDSRRQEKAQQSEEAPRAQSGDATPRPAQQAEQATTQHPATLPQIASGSSWLDSALSPMAANAFESTAASANLSQGEIAQFKAHLQECWHAPAGLAEAAQLRVVLRVSLKPNGTLGAEPAMVAASASPKGPALVQTAMRALLQCQPYAFLPAAKYKEWKVLDLSFSPSGLKTSPLL